jgi:hypothetical protein
MSAWRSAETVPVVGVASSLHEQAARAAAALTVITAPSRAIVVMACITPDVHLNPRREMSGDAGQPATTVTSRGHQGPFA